MKYIKTFEKLNKYEEAGVIEIIRNIIDSFNDVIDEFDINCPFLIELGIIHQKDYMTDIYNSALDDSVYSEEMKKVSYEDFIKTYDKLLEKAPKIIIEYLKKEPKWYREWMNNYEDLDIPDFIINANKYNL